MEAVDDWEKLLPFKMAQRNVWIIFEFCTFRSKIENCKCKGENTFVIQVYSNYSLLSFDIFPFPFFVRKSFV